MTGKRHILRVLCWIVLVAIAATGVWYVTKHPELLHALKGVSAPYLVIMLVLAFTTILTQGAQFRSISTVFGLKLCFREWFGLTVCKSMYSYLMPGRPGVGAQAAYLKRRHGFSFAEFGSLFAATSLLDAVAASLLGLIACVFDLLVTGASPPALVLVFLGLLGISLGGCLLAAVFANAARLVPLRALRRIASRVSDGLKLLGRHPGVLLRVGAFGALRMVASSSVFFVACLGLKMDVTFPQAVVIGSLASFGVFLPLTPASIGINEGIIAASGAVLGLSAEAAMLAAVVHRAAFVVLVFGLGWIFNHMLLAAVLSHEESDVDVASGAE